MELWIVRHGETITNSKKILQGTFIQGQLSKLGYLQANITGIRLKDVKFESVYCSNLNRSKETLEEIVKHSIHLKKQEKENFIYDNYLNEKDLGILSGCKVEILNKIKENLKVDFRKLRIPKGMSSVDLFIRIKDWLIKLIENNVRSDYTKYCLDRILTKIDNMMRFKISEIENNFTNLDYSEFHYTTSNNISNYMLDVFQDNSYNNKTNLIVEDESLVDKFKNFDKDKKKEIIINIKEKFNNIKECRLKHLLLNPNEVEEIDKDNISNYFNNISLNKTTFTEQYEDIDKLNLDIALKNQNIIFDNEIYNDYLYSSNNNSKKIKKILIITHNGVIIELLNVISRLKGSNNLCSVSSVDNCSLTIIKIYCSNCKGECKLRDNKLCKVEIDIILIGCKNHLNSLN